jgi:hypothetical protein
MNSTIYFAAAALLLFAAGLIAGRKTHRQLTRPKMVAIIATVTILTLVTIFLLLKLFSRKEGEPPRQPPDYSAATGSG